VRTGPDSELALEMDGSLGPLLRVQGQMSAQLGDFLSLSGGLYLEQSTRDLTLDETADEVQRLSIEASARSQPAIDPTRPTAYRLQLALDGKTYTTADLGRDASAQAIEDAINAELVGNGGFAVGDGLTTDGLKASMVTLTGRFALGDVITLTGITPEPLRYTVLAEDLSADGKGSSVRASDGRAAVNLTAKLAALISAQAQSKVSVSVWGWSMLLTAKTASGFELQIDKSGHTEGVTVERMASSQAQGEAFELTGRYNLGNVITLSGLANQNLRYTFSADDMRRDTQNKRGAD